VLRLSWYVARLQSGVMQAVTRAERAVDAGAIAVIDGHDGIGQVLAASAAREAIARAKTHGIAAVAVRNSNHFGTAAYFTRLAPAAGCIALLTTNASPAMAPWGAREKLIGNNPWSLAAPAGRHAPMILDIANTVVARGKVYLARQRGETIPPGWAIDADGAPTTDAAAAIAGIILPMGEHKGYAISLMMDVLSGVLSGSGFADGVHGPYQAEQRSGCGHLMIALDVERFLPMAEFGARMEQLIATIKRAPLAPGFESVFYPGEIEAENDHANRQRGITLPDDTIADLRRLARDSALEETLPF
jgi:LDH2 family malate/lactate/ureidoglycolate dehydrogenase